ncbi:MAG: acyl-CoA/acyl-ACP dehydrogenase [Caldisphaeraceae archaeon]|nr:acyl-CoA/acyl-ACP dehydrogenase [Caldisphaeraceae archaeon]
MAIKSNLLENTFYQHDKEAILLRRSVKEFSEKYVEPMAMKLDQAKSKEEVLNGMKKIIEASSEIRLLSLIVPEHLGGMGGLIYMGSNALEVLAYYDAGAATTIGATWLGLLPVYIGGTLDGGATWEKWLRPFAEADEAGKPQVWSFAITEPTAGSDYERIEGRALPEMTTAATQVEGGYRISGRKVFISNSPIASHMTVFAVTDKGRPYETMMCAVVTKDMGFKIEQVYDKMGHRSAPTGEVVFDDIYVPEENVICKPGLGWNFVKMTLAMSRAPVGAIGLGIAKRAFDKAVAYSLERNQGGKRLIDHQLIKYKLATMLEKILVSEYSIYGVSKKVDGSFPPSELEPSLAKSFGGDVAVKVSLEAIQIMGGYGYMKEMEVEKIARDAKLIQIYEGTNEVNRLTAIENLLGL